MNFAVSTTSLRTESASLRLWFHHQDCDLAISRVDALRLGPAANGTQKAEVHVKSEAKLQNKSLLTFCFAPGALNLLFDLQSKFKVGESEAKRANERFGFLARYGVRFSRKLRRQFSNLPLNAFDVNLYRLVHAEIVREKPFSHRRLPVSLHREKRGAELLSKRPDRLGQKRSRRGRSSYRCCGCLRWRSAGSLDNTAGLARQVLLPRRWRECS